LAAIAKDGHVVMLGFLGGTKLPAETDISGFLFKRCKFEGSSLRSRTPEYQGKLRDMLQEHALPRIVKGEFNVPIEKVLSWKDIVKAHELMESNQTKGKIICTVD
jgi:NADPH:quinone reductase-like Zn-dependent oxidoreductase